MSIRPRILPLLLLCAFQPLSFTHSHALSEAYRAPFRQEINFLIMKAPPYVWGGCNDTGADCSGLIWWAAKRAGMPVKRTTAIEMWRGSGNWLGKDIKFMNLEQCDLIWWSWKNKPNRPFGHVGLVHEGENGIYQIFHASTCKKHAILQPCADVFIRDFAGAKRLSFGD